MYIFAMGSTLALFAILWGIFRMEVARGRKRLAGYKDLLDPGTAEIASHQTGLPVLTGTFHALPVALTEGEITLTGDFRQPFQVPFQARPTKRRISKMGVTFLALVAIMIGIHLARRKGLTINDGTVVLDMVLLLGIRRRTMPMDPITSVADLPGLQMGTLFTEELASVLRRDSVRGPLREIFARHQATYLRATGQGTAARGETLQLEMRIPTRDKETLRGALQELYALAGGISGTGRDDIA